MVEKLRIAALRVNRGLTQEELADAMNVSRVTVCNWEKGKGMTIPTLCKLAKFYQIPIDAIDLTQFTE